MSAGYAHRCTPRRAALVALAVAAMLGACRKRPGDDGSVLDRVPAEADVVVMLQPTALAGTWMDALAEALARRADIPACVVARARTAGLVVVAWSHALPEDGWLVAFGGSGGEGGGRTGSGRADRGAGGTGSATGASAGGASRGAGNGATDRTSDADAPCDALAIRGGIATWSRALDPRFGDAPGFFDDRALRNRWGALPARPVRALAEHELSAGILAHTDAWLDPRDGVEAHATIRLDDPDAALGVRARLDRWRADLDADRLGGAWPVAEAIAIEGPQRGDTAIRLRVRLAGEPGRTAAPLFATAIALGADRSDRAPCPLDTTADRWHVACRDGEVTVPLALRDDLLANAATRFDADVVVTTTREGAADGLRLATVGAFSPLLALGFREGDGLRTLDGASITSIAQVAARLRTARIGDVLTVGFVRAGRPRVLRFRFVVRAR